MGIDVALKHVTFNATHERRVSTDVRRNPASWKHRDLEITSIFKRIQSHDGTDGNPLIYALKARKGYTTDFATIRALRSNGEQILSAALVGKAYDIIVPIPSSSAIPSILARRVERLIPGAHILPCLKKSTYGEVLAALPNINTVRKRERRDFGAMLKALQAKSPGLKMEIKDIDKRLREYISPISALPNAKSCAGATVLLVDDLVGSGTSLMAAARALRGHGATSLAALTLLSRLG